MTRKTDKVGPLLEALAIKIATEALANHVVSVVETSDGKEAHVERPTTFEDRLDAFGKLTTYQIGLIKAKAKNKDADDDGQEDGTMSSFQKKLKLVSAKEE